MFCEYILAAMSKAIYEVIDDEQPYYGEVPELKGVWATGKTAEECRKNLKMAIEDWISLSLKCDLPIPPIEGHKIEAPEAPIDFISFFVSISRNKWRPNPRPPMSRA